MKSRSGSEVSCVILAGGKGSRLGQDKKTVSIGSQSLIELTISHLDFLGGEIIIVSKEGKTPLLRPHSRLREVADIYPGKGPLNGIYSGLAVSNTFYNLVIACDMPFLNPALLIYVLECSKGFDLTLPRISGLVEMLHGVYSKNCLAPIKQLLERNSLSVSQLLPLVKVRYIEEDEVDRFDPEHLSFFNINTRADLEKARKLSGALL